MEEINKSSETDFKFSRRPRGSRIGRHNNNSRADFEPIEVGEAAGEGVSNKGIGGA